MTNRGMAAIGHLRLHASRTWLSRTLNVGLTAALLTEAVVKLIAWTHIQAPVDWHLYSDAALRWQAGGSFYDVNHVFSSPVLYPPVLLWLLVPFSHVPSILWWLVPLGLLIVGIAKMRPSGWAWPVMAFCLVTPQVQGVILTGRPTMWVAAFLALGLASGGWAAFVLVKPSLFPFALAGARRRSWWWATGAFALLCLPFGEEWVRWMQAMLTSGFGPLYSLQDLPLLAIPVAVWMNTPVGQRVLGTLARAARAATHGPTAKRCEASGAPRSTGEGWASASSSGDFGGAFDG